ncbi:tetratricopeptide repeat protein [Labrys neptuniae]|uniref:Tetratricopeptide repeat protein n=1 Tax=Labrys neptuniae TaxID=376174 RepID=A0ABV3PM34_9HYPH
MNAYRLMTVAAAMSLWLAVPAAGAPKGGCASDDPAIAIPACTTAINRIAVTPGSQATAYLQRGRAYYRQKQYGLAINDLGASIRHNDKSYLAYVFRGLSYAELGDHNAAIDDYDKAIAIKPGSAEVYFYRANSRSEQDDIENAIVDYSRAVDLDPRMGPAFANRGNLQQRLGRHDKAVADYTKAIALKQGVSLVYSNRANSYVNLKRYDLAMADFDKAIAADGGNFNAYNNRANLHYAKGEIDEAIADVSKAIALNPGMAEFHSGRCALYLAKGALREALADCDTAIAARRDYAEAYLNRGLAHWRLEEREAGLSDMEMAFSINPNLPNVQRYVTLFRASKAVQQAEAGKKDAPASSQKAAAEGSRRVALVIGNSRYAAVSQLPNPRRDADLVAAALRTAGVQDVTVAYDLGRAGLVEALRSFSAKADAADWAILYYAGHGMELMGQNYLIPVDARLQSDRDVPDETVSLQRVLSALSGARRLKLVLLDACRNNPFAAQMTMTAATRSVGRGLSRVEPSGATLVVYSAKEGTVAEDGDSQHSAFAEAFARRVVEPGLEINKVFRFVTSDVMSRTANRQEPFVYGSLPPEDFIFTSAQNPPSSATSAP